jgi:hypothetical protein
MSQGFSGNWRGAGRFFQKWLKSITLRIKGWNFEMGWFYAPSLLKKFLNIGWRFIHLTQLGFYG